MEIEIDIDINDMPINERKMDDYFDEFELTNREYHLYMNRGSRREMLDRYSVSDQHYAIFDGHGTPEVSEFLSNKLHMKLKDHMQSEDYKRLFNDLDAQLTQYQESGSVALLLTIQNKTVTIASLGDSKALVISPTSTKQLSVTHLPNQEKERERIEAQGGWVLTKGKIPRVQGTLSVSRSFGDFALKKYITCEPDITKYEINESDKYIVMASDGFWNELSEEQVKSYLINKAPTTNLAKGLYELIKKQTDYIKDNITIFVIPL